MNHDPNPRRRLGGERGATLILVAFGMIGLLGFAALAVDVGYLMVVRNQLQNAADAAALGGAMKLYTATTGPNWSDAEAQATATIPLNTATNVALTGGVVASGYYNLSGTVPGLHATQGAGDAPAVQVTLSKSSGNNGGPVSLFFAPVLGINTAAVSVTAVAVESGPGTVNAHQLFPVAIPVCFYVNYWDVTTGQPKIDPGTGLPYEFNIDAPNTGNSVSCDAGQWTSFTSGSQSARVAKDLADNGNDSALSVGQSIDIWMQNGIEASVYDHVPPVGTTILVPVVQSTAPGNWSPIVAFAPFVITAVNKNGSHSYISGHLVSGYKITAGSGGGPAYGALTPPTLVK